jgi:hypothetical protein
MSSKRKGRNFELSVYKKLKNELGGLQLSKWSGVSKDDPGDLNTPYLLFELKRFKTASDNKIQSWMKEAEKEAEKVQKIPIVIYKLDRKKAKFMFRLQDLGFEICGNCFVNWDIGEKILKYLNNQEFLPLIKNVR